MLKQFTQEQKKEILASDDYRCTMCGRGIQEGAELHIDPIMAKNKDGEKTVVDALTLCELHTFIGEEGKETILGMHQRLYNEAKENNDEKSKGFFGKVLKVYEKHNMGEDIMLWGK